MKYKSYFTRKIENLESSLGKKKTENNETCPFCKGKKKSWSYMCKPCYLAGKHKLG